jgi:hypothetical protein
MRVTARVGVSGAPASGLQWENKKSKDRWNAVQQTRLIGMRQDFAEDYAGLVGFSLEETKPIIELSFGYPVKFEEQHLAPSCGTGTFSIRDMGIEEGGILGRHPFRVDEVYERRLADREFSCPSKLLLVRIKDARGILDNLI